MCSTCWLALSYLPQEVLSEFQVLQPLFIHSIYFGELGCQNSFLREKKMHSVKLEPEVFGQDLLNRNNGQALEQ